MTPKGTFRVMIFHTIIIKNIFAYYEYRFNVLNPNGLCLKSVNSLLDFFLSYGFKLLYSYIYYKLHCSYLIAKEMLVYFEHSCLINK